MILSSLDHTCTFYRSLALQSTPLLPIELSKEVLHVPNLPFQSHWQGGTLHACSGPSSLYIFTSQILKLGAVTALPALSDYYVIWDMDMIPTRHIPVLYTPYKGRLRNISRPTSLQSEPWVAPAHTVDALQTLVNIGGAWSPGYGRSYRNLMKRE
jgi:hypothetical protein